MGAASRWILCRIGYVETLRALHLAGGGPAAPRRFRGEWPSFAVVEVDADLCERAAELAPRHGLRTLDALHLAAALLADREQLVVATWDERLRRAGEASRLTLLPAG